MTDHLDELVALHAEHGLDKVRSAPGFAELRQRHETEREFKDALNAVRDVLAHLHGTLPPLEPREQVQAAFRQMLFAYRLDHRRRTACGELALRVYGDRWSAPQRAYFAEKRKMASWWPYFLSFTSHRDVDGEYLAVNAAHRPLLRRKLAESSVRPAELETTNLLAKLLNRELLRRFGRGYYDPLHPRDTRDVITKLQAEARRSLTFVQVVEIAMFGRWPSYCAVEYEAAIEDPARALIFVMPESRERFEDPYTTVDYRHSDWHKTVLRKDAFVLEPATTPSDIDAQFNKLKAHVFDQVQYALASLFETGVPN